ncbi:unnamed protein product [Gulo gulo]|uniref:Uncharacterized protein n=1 Tax=Gulo gulo TaxID=48420 RepID=A0A9X9M4H1_GULGU|nr:unnamed protein product [Gulo gulo]
MGFHRQEGTAVETSPRAQGCCCLPSQTTTPGLSADPASSQGSPTPRAPLTTALW